MRLLGAFDLSSLGRSSLPGELDGLIYLARFWPLCLIQGVLHHPLWRCTLFAVPNSHSYSLGLASVAGAFAALRCYNRGDKSLVMTLHNQYYLLFGVPDLSSSL